MCLSISSLSSVVEDGSPGSLLLIAVASTLKPLLVESILVMLVVAGAAVARVRGRLLGGASLESIELAAFLCLDMREGDSAASSAEASRDEGCSRSAVEGLTRADGIWLMRFRLADDPVEEGDDIEKVLQVLQLAGERKRRSSSQLPNPLGDKSA